MKIVVHHDIFLNWLTKYSGAMHDPYNTRIRQFQKEYNCIVTTNIVDLNYDIEFPSEQDYIWFRLKI